DALRADRACAGRQDRNGAGLCSPIRTAVRGRPRRASGRRGRTLIFSASDWALLAPELVLTTGGLILLSLAVFVLKAKEEFLGFLTVLAVVATAVVLAIVAVAAPRSEGPVLGGMFVLDNFALFFKFVILLTIGLTVLASITYVGQAPYPGGEYYA